MAVYGEHFKREDAARTARGDEARIRDAGFFFEFTQRYAGEVAFAICVSTDSRPGVIDVVVHQQRVGGRGVDRPDGARHVCERGALEHVRVGLKLTQNNLLDGRFLLVKGCVGAYVVDEAHGGIVYHNVREAKRAACTVQAARSVF